MVHKYYPTYFTHMLLLTSLQRTFFSRCELGNFDCDGAPCESASIRFGFCFFGFGSGRLVSQSLEWR